MSEDNSKNATAASARKGRGLFAVGGVAPGDAHGDTPRPSAGSTAATGGAKIGTSRESHGQAAGTPAERHVVPPASAETDTRHDEVRMKPNAGCEICTKGAAAIAPVRDTSIRGLLAQGAPADEVEEALFGVLRDFDGPENRLACERAYFGPARGDV